MTRFKGKSLLSFLRTRRESEPRTSNSGGTRSATRISDRAESEIMIERANVRTKESRAIESLLYDPRPSERASDLQERTGSAAVVLVSVAVADRIRFEPRTLNFSIGSCSPSRAQGSSDLVRITREAIARAAIAVKRRWRSAPSSGFSPRRWRN